MTTILGIDPSMKTGVACWTGDKTGWGVSFEEIHAPKGITSPLLQSLRLADKVLEYVMAREPDFVLIEDYAFMARGTQVHKQVERGTLIRVTLLAHQIRWFAVNPSNLKKYATEQGNCKKDLILKEVFKRWGIDCDTDNEADAAALAMFGAALVGAVHFSRKQAEALDKFQSGDPWQEYMKTHPSWV